MSDLHIDTIENPAWQALIIHFKEGTVPSPSLLRAAYLEHERTRQKTVHSDAADCFALREEWMENAELIHPSSIDSLSNRLDSVVETQAKTAPKPLTPRFPIIAKVPFLRRFVR